MRAMTHSQKTWLNAYVYKWGHQYLCLPPTSLQNRAMTHSWQTWLNHTRHDSIHTYTGGDINIYAYHPLLYEIASYGYIVAATRACTFGCTQDRVNLPLDPPGFGTYYQQQLKVCFICTGWQRPIGCPVSIGHFPQKSPVISGSFAENDLQLKASYGSSPPCTNSNSRCVLFVCVFMCCGMFLIFDLLSGVYKIESMCVYMWNTYEMYGCTFTYIDICKCMCMCTYAYSLDWGMYVCTEDEVNFFTTRTPGWMPAINSNWKSDIFIDMCMYGYISICKCIFM